MAGEQPFGFLIHGQGAPSDSFGADGQIYLDRATGLLYGPKQAGAWPPGPLVTGGGSAQAVIVENGGLLGAAADAVTGWPDQRVNPASAMGVAGGAAQDIRATKNDLDQLLGLVEFNTLNGAWVSLANAESDGDLSGLDAAVYSIGPGPWEVWVDNEPGDGFNFSGTFVFEASPLPESAPTVASVPAIDLVSGAFVPAGTALSGTGRWLVLGPAAYARIRCNAFTSGFCGVAIRQLPAASPFGWGIPGLPRGGVGSVQDAANQPKHLAANASTLVKDRAGLLGRVVVNKAGAGGNTLTLYDGTDAGGAVLAVIDTTVIAQREYQVSFAVGLYAVLATGTAADCTLTYA